MKKLQITIIFLNLIAVIPAMGQSSQPIYKTTTPRDFILKVSQFGQFVKRFNYEEDFWGNAMTTSFSKRINRNAYIGFLFNNKDKRVDSASSAYSKEYEKLKEVFIKNVVDKKYKINRVSDSLYSIAVCEITYRNRPELMKLILKQQSINQGLAWVITDVMADFLYDENNNSGCQKFIPPTSNEVNYIHLKHFFENRDSLACYAYQGYTCNRLSIFFHLLHCGDIQYKFVKSVTYFISDIPGWLIQIREYNREGDNSGWLIENILRINKPINDYIKTAAQHVNDY